MEKTSRILLIATVLTSAALAEWQPSGPYGGSATAVAIDRSNPDVMLLGARNSLLYRSADSGQSWQRLPFPRHVIGAMSAVLIDAANPKRYLVGLNADHNPEAGVWISGDEGQTWRRPPSLNGLSVNALVQWPGDPRRLVAGTRDGVWVSADGGESWKRISKPYNHELRSVTAVAIDPLDPKVIYAGTTHLPWKTVDEGQRWESIHNGMIDDSDVFSIFIDPARPERVLASACSGIYLSQSAGASWSKVRGIPGTMRRTHVIRQHPENKQIIYAGTTLGLLKSLDGGATFRRLNDLHVLSMAFDPRNADTFWLAAEGSGLWLTRDGGATLERQVNGFVSRRVVDTAWAGDRMWVNTVQDGETGGIYVSENGGRVWELAASARKLGDQHINLLAASPSRPELLLAANQRKLLRSTDGGENWKPVPHPFPPGKSPAPRIQALAALRSGGTDLFFAGTDQGLWRSADGGVSWKPAPLSMAKVIQDVKFIRSSPNGERLVVKSGATLYQSANGSNWWPLPVLIPTSLIYDISVGDGEGEAILLATARGMLRSENAGKIWQTVSAGLDEGTVNSVARNPGKPGHLYAAQFGQLFESEDFGKTWRKLPQAALREATIRRLWFHPGHQDRLLALTPDLGVFYLDLPTMRVHNR